MTFYGLLQALSSRHLGPRQQFAKVVVHAGDTKIRLPTEGLAQVVRLVCLAVEKFDHRQDEVVRLVERVEDLVARDGDRRRACAPHSS